MIFLFALLAEISEPSKSDWVIVSALGGPGFAMWYGWYTTRYTIPGIVKDHKETVKTIVESHEKQIDKIVTQLRDSACKFNNHEHA